MLSHSLDIISDEHFDFDVFSINSKESIYRIIHVLNEALDIDLQLQDLLDYTHKTGEDFYFPLYSFIHEELNIEFYLIPNKTSFQPNDRLKNDISDLFSGEIEQTIKLLPELENSDCFLLIKGSNRYLYNYTIYDTIKKLAIFAFVDEVFLSDLKDKKSIGNLLF